MPFSQIPEIPAGLVSPSVHWPSLDLWWPLESSTSWFPGNPSSCRSAGCWMLRPWLEVPWWPVSRKKPGGIVAVFLWKINGLERENLGTSGFYLEDLGVAPLGSSIWWIFHRFTAWIPPPWCPGFFLNPATFASSYGTACLLANTALWGFLGVNMVLPIGGADMPVVVSLLNAFSGLATSAAGFMLSNDLLTISGQACFVFFVFLQIFDWKALPWSFGVFWRHVTQSCRGSWKNSWVEKFCCITGRHVPLIACDIHHHFPVMCHIYHHLPLCFISVFQFHGGGWRPPGVEAAGALIASSGTLLSDIMCRGINRSMGGWAASDMGPCGPLGMGTSGCWNCHGHATRRVSINWEWRSERNHRLWVFCLVLWKFENDKRSTNLSMTYRQRGTCWICNTNMEVQELCTIFDISKTSTSIYDNFQFSALLNWIFSHHPR